MVDRTFQSRAILHANLGKTLLTKTLTTSPKCLLPKIGTYSNVFDHKNSNFERSFAPQTWLRSARNFGKTRFGRFATFDFSTSKNFFGFCFAKFFGFSWFSADFWGAAEFLTSPAASTSNFASDTPFLKSVRPKIDVSGLRSWKISKKLLIEIR